MISGFTKLVYTGVTFLAFAIIDWDSDAFTSFILAIEFIIDFLAFLAQSPLLPPPSDPLLELEFSLSCVLLFESVSLLQKKRNKLLKTLKIKTVYF